MDGPRGYETTVLTLEHLYSRHVPLTGWMQEEIPLGGGEQRSEQTVLIHEIARVPPRWDQSPWCAPDWTGSVARLTANRG